MNSTRTGITMSRIVAVLALVATALGVTAAPAAAATWKTDQTTVAPGVVRQHWHHSTRAGVVHADVLRFKPSDPRVQLAPELGGGRLYGFEAPHEATRRLGDSGAVAAVNGQFFSWSADPVGEPRGYLVRDGAYLSEPERGRAWRGSFGLTHDDRIVFGRPGFSGRLTMPDGTALPVGGVNRRPRQPSAESPGATEIVALDHNFGGATGTPSGTVEVVLRNVSLLPASNQSATVTEIHTGGNGPIARDGITLSATGSRAQQIRDRLSVGDTVTLRFDVTTGWSQLRHAVQGGPLILDGGRRTARASWEQEGFNPASHSEARHPRTMVGVAPGGEMLLVTADGRTRTSPGLSLAESQDLMLALGAVEAIHVDGGGSTQMAVDDRLVNRPCCDALGYRNVADNLVLRSTVPLPDVPRLGVGDRYARSASIATSVWSGGTRVALLASGEDFADGLSAGPLAERLGAPLLLTRDDRLPSEVRSALQQLDTKVVGVLGGSAAVSDGVLDAVRGLGIDVHRLAGSDRFETAARVAQVLGRPESGRAYVVASHNFPDALTAGVAGAADGSPVLLTPADFLHDRTRTSLKRLGVGTVVLVGGTKAVSGTVETQLREAGFAVERLAGPDRYATATAVADALTGRGLATPAGALLADGTDFDSALMAGPVAARRDAPLLLTHPLSLDRAPATRDWLARHRPPGVTLIGERSVLSSWLARQVGGLR